MGKVEYGNEIQQYWIIKELKEENKRLKTTLKAIQKYAAERDFIIGMEILEDVCRDTLKEVQGDG